MAPLTAGDHKTKTGHIRPVQSFG